MNCLETGHCIWGEYCRGELLFAHGDSLHWWWNDNGIRGAKRIRPFFISMGGMLVEKGRIAIRPYEIVGIVFLTGKSVPSPQFCDFFFGKFSHFVQPEDDAY